MMFRRVNLLAAKAFFICNVNKFSEASYFRPIQQTVTGLENEGEPEIKVELRNNNFLLGFDQYDCHHDFKVKVFGKTYYKTFNYYFLPKDFYLYYSSNANLSIISLNTAIAKDFIKHLNESKEFDLNPVEVDFDYIAPLVSEMSGVWVSDLKRMHVKTAAYFGSYVNKSEEFIEAAKEGVVSSVQMKFIHPNTNEEHTIGISKQGTVTLYDSFERIEDELELVFIIFNELIKKPAVI